MRRATTPVAQADDDRGGRGTEPRPASSSRRLAALLLVAIALIAAGCSAPPAGGSTTPLQLWTFDADLEGWQAGTTETDGWGSADWRSWCGSDRERGCVILDGTGGAGSPNAWIERAVALPAGATTLRALTTAHNRNGADSLYRVRLIDAGGNDHVLVDWASSSGAEDAYDWFAIEASIAAFAGTTVTLFFEGADDGPGVHEQRYYDDIGIY